MSLPVDCVWHVYIFLNLPFSPLLVCVVFFAIFLALLTVDIQTSSPVK
jgi:hypothetical protein